MNLSFIHKNIKNAALNTLFRSLEHVGMVHSKRTPVETALPIFASDTGSDTNLQRVIETGSPALKKAASAAE
ncbi:MAG: hypothetical protein J07HX5_00474 [halophilic archaeon J07HX5]|nr:MAG: hypothetical protein J07HX5_00474 [halophilic archaeon J07HX5]